MIELRKNYTIEHKSRWVQGMGTCYQHKYQVVHDNRTLEAGRLRAIYWAQERQKKLTKPIKVSYILDFTIK